MSEQPMDAPEYETLDLLESGAEPDLVDAAVAYMEVALPGWDPRAGNTEIVLLEGLAMMLGVEVLALQQAPSQVLEQLLQLYGVPRHPGTGATIRVQFSVTGSAPIQTIPLGTRLRYESEETDETFDFLTTEPVEILTSETLVGVASVQAELIGSEVNGLPAGTELELVGNLYFVESAITITDVINGADEEEDDSYYARASSVLSRLTSTLVLPEHFQYAATSVSGIGRARVLDLYNPSTPGVEAPGHVTVAVADAQGEPLAPVVATDLHAMLEQQALASLVIHVIEPSYTTVDVAVTVRPAPGFNSAQVTEAVTAALQEWVNPGTWDWSSEVGEYALVSVIGAVPAVQVIMSAPATVPLPGLAPLPRLGTVTVTVA